MLKNRVNIWAATTAFYAPIHALQNGIQTIYDLDSAMTNLMKVTDETSKTYSEFLLNASQIANEIGGLTLDVVKSTTEWAKLGYTIQQAQSLARQTIVYQNVGDIKSAEDASQSLISTIKGFGIEVDKQGKNIENIVDIYNEVGNKFAISSAGIGEAMRRSASSLAEAGNTIEESVALATAANSTIQDPARVGQALKTISMRLRGVSEDGEDLSSLIPSLEKKFNSIGLTLQKEDKTFKNTYEIFKDLSSIWNTGMLSDLQKAETLELVAGKLQGNIAASLIQNFSDAQGALEAGLNSMGSAAKENQRYLDSIAGKVAVFMNSVSTFWQKSIESDTVKNIVSAATRIVDAFDNITNVIVLASGVMLAFKSKALVGLATGAYSSVKALFTFRAALQSTTVSAEATAVAVNGASVAMVGFQRALGAIGIALTVGSLLYTVLNDVNSVTAESNKLLEENNKRYSDHADEIKNTTEFYKENHQAIRTDNDVKNQLFEMQNKLIDTFGKEAKGIDLVNGKYEEQIQKVEKLNKTNLNNKIKDAQLTIDAINERKFSPPSLGAAGNKSLLGIGESQYKVGGDIGLGKLNIQDYYERLLDLQDDIRSKNEEIFTSQQLIPKNGQEWSAALTAVQNKLSSIQPLMDQINTLEDDKRNLIKITTAEQSKFTTEQKTSFETISEVFKSQPLTEYKESIGQLAKIVRSVDGKNAASIVKELKEIPAIKTNTPVLKSLEDLLTSSTTAVNGIDNVSTSLEKVSKDTEDYIDRISSLSSAYNTLHEGEALSADTVYDLISKYPTLAEHLANTNDLTFNKGELLKEVAEIERSTRETEITNALNSVENTRRELQAKQDLYKQFYENIIAAGGPIDAWMVGSSALTKEEQAQLTAATAQSTQLKAQLKVLNQPLSFYSAPSKEKAPKKDKDAPSQISATESLINSINAQADAQAKLNEVTSAAVDKYESEKNYAEAIKATNELLKGQQSELNKLNFASLSLDSERSKIQSANKSYNMSSWVDANGEQTTAFVNLYNSLGSKSAQDSLQSLFDKWQSLTQAIRDNREQMSSVKESLEETRLKGTKSYFEIRTQELAKYDEQLEQSEQIQSRYKDGSVQYITEEQKQIKIMADKRLALQKENDWIRKRLDVNDKAKTAEKLTADQVALLTEKLKENSDAWFEVDGAQRQAIETLQSNYIEKVKENISSLVDTIKNSLNQDEIFDFDAFNTSVDEIYTALEHIDGKFNYISSNDTTSSVRIDTMNFANEIVDIANQVSDFAKTSTEDVTALGSQINKQVAYVSELRDKLKQINQEISTRQLRYKEEEAALENTIKVIEDSYDSQIKAQQNKLDLLDAEIEKEDRIKSLKEINDELDKTKADKRFSYIDEFGNEILTYDKARVDELENEKNELVKQYEREDVRNAIENEIDRLQNAKDAQSKILQSRLDDMRSIHEQEIATLQLYQTNLSSLLSTLQSDTESKLTSFETAMSDGLEKGKVSVETGTEALQGVIDTWMSSSLITWDSHITSVQTKLSSLQALYASMAALASTSATVSTTTKTTTSTASTKTQTPEKYHYGGKAGSPPLKPNEVPAVLEVGEWVIPEEKLQSFRSNVVSNAVGQMLSSLKSIGSNVMSSIVNKTNSVVAPVTYDFSGMTVKANNPLEFMDTIQTHINSLRK